jgi:hypothetical protein
LVGWRFVAATSIDTCAEIVHHHMGTVSRQAQGMLTTDAATGPRNDNDSTLTQLGHDRDPFPDSIVG